MKRIGNYTFECCGRRLRGKDNFCPHCGAKAERPALSEASLLLVEIDKRARGCESQASAARKGLAAVQRGEYDEHRSGLPAKDQARMLEKSAASFDNAASWYRRVERLINDLLATKTSTPLG